MTLIPLADTVTLSAPLPANAVNLVVIPSAWSFPTESTQLNTAATYSAGVRFTFSTDENGIITGCSFQVNYEENAPTWRIFASSTQAGDAVGSYYQDYPSVPHDATITGLSASAGTWTCQPPPPINPLAAQVAALESWQAYWQWQGVGWKERADSLAQQLACESGDLNIGGRNRSIEEVKLPPGRQGMQKTIMLAQPAK